MYSLARTRVDVLEAVVFTLVLVGVAGAIILARVPVGYAGATVASFLAAYVALMLLRRVRRSRGGDPS